MMNDVLSGRIDYAFTQSSWFEANHPDKMPLFHFHHLVQTSFQGDQYPFLTSTDLVPNPALTAAPHITSTLRRQVFDALRRLNTSNPAARAAGIATFTLPASYEKCRSLVEGLGIMVKQGGVKTCLDGFKDLLDFVACPSGYALDPAASENCVEDELRCPAGLACICRSCQPVPPQNVFNWPVLLGLCLSLASIGLGLAVASRVSMAWVKSLVVVQVLAAAVRRTRKRSKGGAGK